MDVNEELASAISAIKRINRGRGIQSPVVVPDEPLANLLSLSPHDEPEKVRKVVIDAWRRGADLMPRDLGQVLLIVSGISYAAPESGARMERAARFLDRDARTARRRYADAVKNLASQLLAKGVEHQDDSPDTGFYIVDFAQIADFTQARPRFVGHRTIRVTAPELTEIVDRVYLPRLSENPPVYRCLSGVSLVEKISAFANIWQFTLRLPRPLHAGELYDFSTSIQLPHRDAVDPLACFIATRHTARARIELWLGNDAHTAQVWELSGIPHLGVADPTPRGPYLLPDDAGRIVRTYSDLIPGFSYGVRWQWEEPNGTSEANEFGATRQLAAELS